MAKEDTNTWLAASSTCKHLGATNPGTLPAKTPGHALSATSNCSGQLWGFMAMGKPGPEYTLRHLYFPSQASDDLFSQNKLVHPLERQLMQKAQLCSVMERTQVRKTGLHLQLFLERGLPQIVFIRA